MTKTYDDIAAANTQCPTVITGASEITINMPSWIGCRTRRWMSGVRNSEWGTGRPAKLREDRLVLPFETLDSAEVVEQLRLLEVFIGGLQACAVLVPRTFVQRLIG
ncbi:MAG TPA: hypothetical protein VFG22_03365 [Polyangiales bacterium]|nr:hypothetical protein [Polyangiales bacterium]